MLNVIINVILCHLNSLLELSVNYICKFRLMCTFCLFSVGLSHLICMKVEKSSRKIRKFRKWGDKSYGVQNKLKDSY